MTDKPEFPQADPALQLRGIKLCVTVGASVMGYLFPCNATHPKKYYDLTSPFETYPLFNSQGLRDRARSPPA
jgi:hypothetical protein